MRNTEHSASDFNLYTHHEDAVEAAKELNNAFAWAGYHVNETHRYTRTEAFSKIVRPVMEVYAHVGACDSDAKDVIFECYQDWMNG